MQLTDINGIELEVYDSGTNGEPVVFVPVFRDEWHAVLAEPVLSQNFRVIYYYRRGYGKSSKTGLPLSLQQQAADCRAVMQHLGIDRAHLAGLSGGAAIILQFVLNFPDTVHTLALLEPALVNTLKDTKQEFDDLMKEVAPFIEENNYNKGLDTFMRGVVGEKYAAAFDRNLPSGWFDRLLEDAETLKYDMFTINSWEFTAEDAARISAPVLNMKGAISRSFYHEIHTTLQSWIPNAESAVLPDTTHAIPQTNPQGTAERLVDFFSRHPME